MTSTIKKKKKTALLENYVYLWLYYKKRPCTSSVQKSLLTKCAYMPKNPSYATAQKPGIHDQ